MGKAHIGRGWNLGQTPKDWMKMKSRQWCNECGNPLDPEIKGDPHDADTWMWTECDYCNEPVCRDCMDVSPEGHTICTTCLQDPNHRRDWDTKTGEAK